MSDNNLTGLAVFDVDDTLIKGDSFMPYLYHLRGRFKTMYALAASAIAYFRERPADHIVDMRTFLKDQLMRRLLKGVSVTDSNDAAEKLRIWRQWYAPMRDKLMDHYAKGHHIVIASGGLDLYLPEILKDITYHALICTEVGHEGGVITGQMTNGNCVRERKAELVSEYINAYVSKNGPIGESWGYGNYPHDVPMLQLVKHRVLV
jgi:HAD superfamily hydrolase (TIGR01490 family)